MRCSCWLIGWSLWLLLFQDYWFFICFLLLSSEGGGRWSFGCWGGHEACFFLDLGEVGFWTNKSWIWVSTMAPEPGNALPPSPSTTQNPGTSQRLTFTFFQGRETLAADPEHTPIGPNKPMGTPTLINAQRETKDPKGVGVPTSELAHKKPPLSTQSTGGKKKLSPFHSTLRWTTTTTILCHSHFKNLH